MSRTLFAPWQVWWIDFDPVRGSEQAKKRPAVIVSSEFHLTLLGGDLVSVLPLTTTQRDWPWRVRIATPRRPSWVITEQIRTVSAARFSGTEPMYHLTDKEIADTRAVLIQMVSVG